MRHRPAGPLVRVRGVDQDEPGGEFGIEVGERADREAAEGVPGEDVGRFDARCDQRMAKILGDRPGVPGSSCGFTPAQPGAVVRDGSDVGQFPLDPVPVRRKGAHARLEDDCGAIPVRPTDQQVHLMTVHVNQNARRWVAPTISDRQGLLNGSSQAQPCRTGQRDSCPDPPTGHLAPACPSLQHPRRSPLRDRLSRRTLGIARRPQK